MSTPWQTLCAKLGIEHPIFCGAMYPCSNPELVAAASQAGAMGIVQPLSLTYVYKYEFRAGLRHIRSLTTKPIGMNVLIEASSKIYLDRMRTFVDIALEEGVRFFVTALGNPKWVVDKVHAAGGVVFHDVTELKWAERAVAAGVDGLICVNARAGGHAGTRSPTDLYHELKGLGLPLVCAGGVGDSRSFVDAIATGYAAVQMGTRFIATTECKASDDYKSAILNAKSQDIVLTELLTGVPVAVINTPNVKKMGLKAGWLGRTMLQHPRMKHWARLFYSLRSFRDLQRSINRPKPYDEIWQAGKSVAGIDRVEPASVIIKRLAAALER